MQWQVAAVARQAELNQMNMNYVFMVPLFCNGKTKLLMVKLHALKAMILGSFQAQLRFPLISHSCPLRITHI